MGSLWCSFHEMRYRDHIQSLFSKEIKEVFKRNKAVPQSSDLVFEILISPYHYSSFLDDLKHWEKNREYDFSFFITVKQLKSRYTFGRIIFILWVFLLFFLHGKIQVWSILKNKENLLKKPSGKLLLCELQLNFWTKQKLVLKNEFLSCSPFYIKL